MNNTFYLAGFINTFNIIPSFVTPVFEGRDQKGYFVQYIEDNKIVLDTFLDFSDSVYLSKVGFYRISDSKYQIVDLQKQDLSQPYALEEPIFGFQTEKSIFYGKILAFMKFLSDFETDDVFLKEEISDFKEHFAKYKSKAIETEIGLYDQKSNELQVYAHALTEHGYHVLTVDVEDLMKNGLIASKSNKSYFFNTVEILKKNRRLEELDRQLKNTNCFSDKYANLIAEINELLLANGKPYMHHRSITKKF